ncbi:MAG TPA: TlpA disulfide reductase family protein [Flavobacterium sp.]|nr:TlpA disulfide reductase family protein [Flavobacterium sp.]
MKKIFLSLLIAAGITSCTQAQKTEFSKEALSEKLSASDGKEISFEEILAKHKGKTVVLDFWASWCSDCVKAMPKVKDMISKNPKAQYVFISLDKTADKWKAGIEKHELDAGEHYLAKDGMKGNFGKAVDLDWIPRYIIVDKKGKIVLYRAIETDFEKINAVLKTLK